MPEPERAVVLGQQLLAGRRARRRPAGPAAAGRARAASRSKSRSWPITAAARSSAPARPELIAAGRHRFDQRRRAARRRLACWASSVRNSGWPWDRSYSSSTRAGPTSSAAASRPSTSRCSAPVPAAAVSPARTRGRDQRPADPARRAKLEPVAPAPGRPGARRRSPRPAGPFGQPAQHPDQRRVQHRRAEHAVGQHRQRPRPGRPRRAAGASSRARPSAQQVGAGSSTEPAQQSRPARPAGRPAAWNGRAARTWPSARCLRRPRAGRPRRAAATVLPMPGSPSTTIDLAGRRGGRPRAGVQVGQLLTAADQPGRARAAAAGGAGWPHLPAQDRGVERGRLR